MPKKIAMIPWSLRRHILTQMSNMVKYLMLFNLKSCISNWNINDVKKCYMFSIHYLCNKLCLYAATLAGQHSYSFEYKTKYTLHILLWTKTFMTPETYFVNYKIFDFFYFNSCTSKWNINDVKKYYLFFNTFRKQCFVLFYCA